MRLAVSGVNVELGGTRIVSDIDVVVEPGQFVGLVGPHGCGKTTLLRTVYRALRPKAGRISVDGDDIWRLPAREAARRTAAVLQERAEDIELTVFEFVATGRTPHKGAPGRDTGADEQICVDALARVDMGHAAERIFDSLSGGERQRTLVARALAQQSQVLVLDEPTNHLDIRHQLELQGLVRGLGITTFAAMHDLDLASRHCDRLFMLHAGRVVATGSVEDVLQPEVVARVFGVSMCRWTNPATGRTFLGFESLTTPLALVNLLRSSRIKIRMRYVEPRQRQMHHEELSLWGQSLEAEEALACIGSLAASIHALQPDFEVLASRARWALQSFEDRFAGDEDEAWERYEVDRTPTGAGDLYNAVVDLAELLLNAVAGVDARHHRRSTAQ